MIDKRLYLASTSGYVLHYKVLAGESSRATETIRGNTIEDETISRGHNRGVDNRGG